MECGDIAGNPWSAPMLIIGNPGWGAWCVLPSGRLQFVEDTEMGQEILCNFFC